MSLFLLNFAVNNLLEITMQVYTSIVYKQQVVADIQLITECKASVMS